MIGKEFKEKLYKVRSIVGNKCYNGINGMEHFTLNSEKARVYSEKEAKRECSIMRVASDGTRHYPEMILIKKEEIK